LIVRPESELPFASFGVAASCIVWPAGTDAVAGLTVTDATGTVVTVSAAVPLLPSEVAVIVAAPTATPVACPVPLTVATAVLLQGDGLRGHNELCDDGAEIGDGMLAAADDRSDGQRRHDHRPIL